jgi:probable F420-dependent oxidoreductase
MEFGFAPIQSEPTFEAMSRQAGLAETLGFDALWAHEHHSLGIMYPSPLMALAALAGVTRRVRLGTNMLLLPLYHPLRVAEEGAMVDVLSGGRLVLGVSAGYAPSDLAAFGVESGDRARRMEEGLALIRAVWTQEKVTFAGSRSELRDYSLFPRPLQRPAPPIYVGALADRAIGRAARLGDGYVLSAGSTFAQIRERIDFYRRALREAGKDPGAAQPIAVNRVVHVAKDREGKATAERFFAEQFLSAYDRWGHADIARLGADERLVAETSRDHFIVGEASECVERIHEYAALGIGHIACLMNFGKPEPALAEASLRRFGEQVLPRCARL